MSMEEGEWVILRLIMLKASRRNPAKGGVAGDIYCSRMRSFPVNLSVSTGTCRDLGQKYFP